MDRFEVESHLKRILGDDWQKHPRAEFALLRFVQEAAVDMEDWLPYLASLKFTPQEWIHLYDKARCDIAVVHLMLANHRAGYLSKELLLG